MQNVKIPKMELTETERKVRSKKRYYSLHEIKNMLDFLPEPARTVVLVAAFTGLRKSELLGLRWEDFNGSELMVRRSRWNGEESATKTESSNAPVPLTKEVVEGLKAHRLRAGVLAQPDLPIFQSGKGTPLDLDNLKSRIIAPAFKWYGWHAFRHGLGTLLYEAGVKDKDIQGILRHSDLRTTMAIYVHSVPKSRIAAMENLGETFANMEQYAPAEGDAVN